MTTPPYPQPAVPSGPQPMNPSDEKLWATLVHVGGIFYFLPSLIGYLVLKDRGPFVRAHTAAALNFQLTMLIASLVGTVLSIIGIGLLILLAVYVVNIVFSIIAAVKANKGEWYTYPLRSRSSADGGLRAGPRAHDRRLDGRAPVAGDDGLLRRLRRLVVPPRPGFVPGDAREINVQAQTLQSFEAFVGQRRERVEVTDLGLPSILWTVLWVGALLNAILLSLIQVRNLRIHLIMAGSSPSSSPCCSTPSRASTAPTPGRSPSPRPTTSRCWTACSSAFPDGALPRAGHRRRGRPLSLPAGLSFSE
jgi:uncharacterized Tic20 family protein